MKLALVGLLAAVVALWLIAKFLLKDFLKFFRVKLKFYNMLPNSFVDLGQYAYTILSAFIIALLGLLCLKSLNALFSYVLAGDLVDFYRLARGVYSPEIAAQSPFKTSHLVSALLFNPLSQLITVYFMTSVIRNFFQRLNNVHKAVVYSESDTLLYGLFSGVVLILLEILLYSQHLNVLSNIAHISYLIVSKLSILFFFIALSHTHLLRTNTYREALTNYLEMSGSLKKVVYSPYGMILFSFAVGAVLSIPFYLGTQFLNNNFLLAAIFLLILGAFYLIYRAGMTKALNCLGFILLSERHEEFVRSENTRYDKFIRNLTYLLLTSIALFLVMRVHSFVMGIVLLSAVILFTGLTMLITYALGVGISIIRTKLIKAPVPVIHLKKVLQNGVKVNRCLLLSSVPVLVVAWSVFMVISFFPHQVCYSNEDMVRAVLDDQGEVLLAEEMHGNPSIATDPSQVPEFLVTSLLLQEDRDFMKQRDFLPSSVVKISNWHGLSIASFYRILFGSGGGSNCNMQLLKNLATNGRAQDLQRKITEFYSSYQLSLSHTPEEILNFYLNTVAFNGGYGHSGIVQAAHHTFNKPLNQLNDLELMYLVRTIIGGTFVVVNNEKITCKEAPAYAQEIKESLLRIATSWRRQGLISQEQLNQLKYADLHFENGKEEHWLQTTTREFLKKEVDQAEVSSSELSLYSSISKARQEKVTKAVGQFKSQMNSQWSTSDCELYAAAVMVEISSGKLVAHYGGEGVTDLADFQNGFPMASTVKPLILLQALEDEVLQEDSKLFDGSKDKNTPKNYRAYSNKEISIDEIISESPNAPLYNLKYQTDALALYKSVEKSMRSMKILPDQQLHLDQEEERYANERNYPLGQNRRMTIKDIAQAYQCVLNDGVWVELNSVQQAFDVSQSTMRKSMAERKKVYDKENCEVIKRGMARTVTSGTAKRLLKYLPAGKNYFAKTGTSNGFIHGYTVLSDGDYLVVSWVSYGKRSGEQLIFNDTPPIPYNSGGASAGVLAAYLLNAVTDNVESNVKLVSKEK